MVAPGGGGKLFGSYNELEGVSHGRRRAPTPAAELIIAVVASDCSVQKRTVAGVLPLGASNQHGRRGGRAISGPRYRELVRLAPGGIAVEIVRGHD